MNVTGWKGAIEIVQQRLRIAVVTFFPDRTLSFQAKDKRGPLSISDLQWIDEPKILAIRLVKVFVIQPEDTISRVQRVLFTVAALLFELRCTHLVLVLQIKANNDTHGRGDEPEGGHE